MPANRARNPDRKGRPNKFYREGPIYWPLTQAEADALIVGFAIGGVTIQEIGACLGLPREMPFDELSVAVSAWMSKRAAHHIREAHWLVSQRTSEPIAMRRYAAEARALANTVSQIAITFDSRTVEGRRLDRIAAKCRRRANRAEIRLERLLTAAGVPAPPRLIIDPVAPDGAPDTP